MKTRTKAIPYLMATRWIPISLSVLAILLSGLAGGIVSLLAQNFAGKEMLALLALLSFCLVFLLSAVKFDFMVLVAFCLFSLVRLEPAPADILFMTLLLVGLLSRKLSLRTLKGASLIHFALWGTLLTNLFSIIGVEPPLHKFRMEPLLYSFRFLLITIYLVAFFYFVKMYVISFQAMRNVIIGYLVSSGIALLLVGFGYLGIGSSAEMFLGFNIRAVGFFKDPNVFGPFLIPMVILLLDEILWPRFITGLYPVKLLGVLVLSAGVILSFSRAAWVNFAVSLLAYLILTVKDKDWSKVISFAVPTLLGLLVVTVPFIEWEGLRGFLKERLSLQDYDWYRFARQLGGINAGLTHLRGVGPGMWFNAHSLYVRALAEQGILGFSALLLFLVTLSKGIFRCARQEIDKPYGLSAKALLASLAGLLVNSFVIDTIHWRHFWLILALSWAVSSVKTAALSNRLEGNQGDNSR